MVMGPPRKMSTCIVVYHHIQELKCSRVNMVMGPPIDMTVYLHSSIPVYPRVKMPKSKYGIGLS